MMFYKKRSNLICEEIDNEYIIFDPDNEQFYELDSLGSLIWDCVETKCSSDIVQTICNEYAVDADNLEADIAEFINDLIALHLIHQTGIV